ncbi:MAG: hypothetical protein ACWA5L_03545 [bacterium]
MQKYINAIGAVMGIIILSSTSVAAQDALSYVQYKYEVAFIANTANKKCSGLTKVGAYAAQHAFKRYREQMIAAGKEAQLKPYEQQFQTFVNSKSCDVIYGNEDIVNRMNEVTGLVDEYLLAIKRSNITTCGSDFREEEILYVMRKADQAEDRLKARPDYQYVNEFAKMAGAELASDCQNIVMSDPLFLLQTDVGSIFVQEIFDME